MKQKMMLVSLLLLLGNGITYSNTTNASVVEQKCSGKKKIINLNLKDVSVRNFYSYRRQINKLFIYRSDQNFLQV
jgi:hypothetical protein